MSKGFTLLELLITISIIAVTAVSSFSAFTRLGSVNGLRSSTEIVENELFRIKQEALSDGTTYQLGCNGGTYSESRLDPATNIYVPIEEQSLSSGISFQNNFTFRYAASGFPMPGYFGTLILQDLSGHTKTIIVSSAGRIRAQ